ncbi:isochorismatase family protein [Streptomyces sp. 5-8]|uniref:Isochorismatase family protein n=1 Tax=Streptomyces musisoli TaxID=2802280 RepID=A0ABS1PAY7_9ACTN|nr:isochorismatase family protein [Streptomyces musisoli]MBL1109534.1 isochorismatase family protein [Streptomyces musisoli]
MPPGRAGRRDAAAVPRPTRRGVSLGRCSHRWWGCSCSHGSHAPRLSHPKFDDELEYGSENWQYVAELTRRDGEPLVHKSYADSFEETDLESVLAELKVGRLLVSGAQTDVCIRSTLHGAVVRGYDATLVADAHTTEDMTKYGAPAPEQVIAHTNLYWKYHSAPGRQGGTVDTAEVTFWPGKR